MKNVLKEKFQNKQQPIGTFVGTGPFIVECLARTGMDYVILDNEHAPLDALSSLDMVRAAEASGICPLARVGEVSRHSILSLLDIGVQGLIIPCVDSAEDVRKVVEYAKFPPLGKRGYSPSRKDGWCFDYPACEGVAANMKNCNEETLIIPQCETVGALNEIEEIAAIEGVDGIFIGPFDLSISMGIPGQFQKEEFKAALERVKKAAHDNGKFCIFFAGTPDAMAAGFNAGYDAMTFSIDALIITNALKAQVSEIRSKIK